MKPNEVIQLAKSHDCKFVDLKFIDLPGIWQHTTIPVSRLSEELFEEGLGFDGSSVRGWQPINASDMQMIPDPTTARVDPFPATKMLSMVCDVKDPITGQPYGRDPRHIAKKCEAYLKSTGIADTIYVGPESEFFIFDSVRYDSAANGCFYEIDSSEAAWNTGADGNNLGYKVRHKEGYFPVPPTDATADIRADMMQTLIDTGIQIEVGHHEVGTAGQGEIGMRFNTLTKMADNLLWFKYVVKNVARRHNKTATFMPKPLFGDNGSGMHCHQSLWKGGKNLFAGEGYAGLSDVGLWYIGGVLKHAKAIAGLTNPTTNSYRRLVKGYEAPVNLAYSSRNRSASIRIPVSGASANARRIEVRFPDSSCNPYLAFAALMLAGLDGVQNRIDPGDPLDKDIYSLAPEELKQVPNVPNSLDEALDALEKDYEFLLKGDVFSRDLLETWVAYKRENELDAVRMRPVPHEFFLYYDI
jgi:glutamine synthetase